ncbi:unannotated protein [freshwater metagenome]|uniref:Unannotated protein n=1 Tax=freshwater metagenome TaxID=449393 RepID=A0A6J7EL82_9ZZZZ
MPGLLEVALRPTHRVVRLAQRVEPDHHVEVRGLGPVLWTVLRCGKHCGGVRNILPFTGVDDLPPLERLAAAECEVGHLRIGVAERIDRRRAEVSAAAVGEDHPAVREVHPVECIGPAVVRPEAHAGERANAGGVVDEVEVVALAPGAVVAHGVEELVGRIRCGHVTGLAASPVGGPMSVTRKSCSGCARGSRSARDGSLAGR